MHHCPSHAGTFMLSSSLSESGFNLLIKYMRLSKGTGEGHIQSQPASAARSNCRYTWLWKKKTKILPNYRTVIPFDFYKGPVVCKIHRANYRVRQLNLVTGHGSSNRVMSQSSQLKAPRMADKNTGLCSNVPLRSPVEAFKEERWKIQWKVKTINPDAGSSFFQEQSNQK